MQNLFWRGASIGITGITGSLGTALSKELLKPEYNISRLMGISRKWQDQDKLKDEIGSDARLRLFIGDVRDIDRLRLALEGVEYLFHAASMKSLPACQYNPIEAIHTNILGTVNVLQAARDCGVRRVVVVSSDKSVQAGQNVYGVTKAMCEQLAVNYNSYSASRQTRYCAARWGNVLGSSGSVVPLFFRQRESGNKLTITHDKMTRFWVSMPEVVQFILRVMEAMIGGEIFVPHLPAARVTTLATTIAPQAEIEIVGIRPGEKLHEVMLTPEESPRTQDLGWAYRIEPQVRPWGGPPYSGGSPVPADWTYSSASAEKLGEAELREMLSGLG